MIKCGGPKNEALRKLQFSEKLLFHFEKSRLNLNNLHFRKCHLKNRHESCLRLLNSTAPLGLHFRIMIPHRVEFHLGSNPVKHQLDPHFPVCPTQNQLSAKQRNAEIFLRLPLPVWPSL